MSDNDAYWLQGIKAAEEKQPRESCPYVGDNDPHKAFNWFGGFDVATIILTDLAGHKFE